MVNRFIKVFLCFGIMLNLSFSNILGQEGKKIVVEPISKYGVAEEKVFREATDAFINRKDSEMSAIFDDFKHFIDKYPTNSLARNSQFMLGESLFLEGIDLIGNHPNQIKEFSDIIKKAIKEYESVVNSNAGTFFKDNALYRLAECYYALADFDKAFDICEKYPYNYLISDVLYLFGLIYLQILEKNAMGVEQWDVVIDIFENLNYSAKEDSVALALGLAFLGKKDYKAALEKFNGINTDKTHYFAGKCYESMNRYILAIGEYKCVIKNFPKSTELPKAYFSIAECLYKSNKYEDAISAYNEFSKLFPEHEYQNYMNYKIAVCYFKAKEYEKAISVFLKVTKEEKARDELKVFSEYLIGESYYRLDRLEEAVSGYKECITNFPATERAMYAYFMIGWCYFKLESYSEAESAVKHAIGALPSENMLYLYLYFLLGNIQYMEERYDDAATSYQMVVDRATYGEAIELRNAAFFMLNFISYQEEDYQRIVTGYQYVLSDLIPEINNDDWNMRTYFLIGDACYRMRYINEARELFTAISKEYAKDDYVYTYALDNLAWCASFEKNYAKAENIRKMIKNIFVSSDEDLSEIGIRNYFELGNILFNQREYLKALENYDLFVEKSSDTKLVPQAFYRAGICYYKLEYYTAAITEWKKMLAQYPKDDNALRVAYKIADTYYKAGKYKEGIEMFQFIIDNFDGKAEVMESYLRIAQSYFNAREYGNATIAFKNFMFKYPDSEKAFVALDNIETSIYRRKEVEIQEGKVKSDVVNVAKDLDDTLSDFVKEYPDAPVTPEILYRMGKNYYEEEGYHEAVNKLVAFFKIGGYSSKNIKQLSEGQYFLAESYYMLDQFQEAINAYKLLIANFFDSEHIARAYFRMGSAYLKVKEYDNSIEAYNILIDEYPNSKYIKIARYNLAFTYKEAGMIDESCETFVLYYQFDPNNKDSLQVMIDVGDMYMKQRDYDKTINTFREIFPKVDPVEKIALQCKIGECYEKQFNIEEAVQVYSELLDMGPVDDVSRLSGLVKLAELLEEEKDLDGAYSTYEEILASTDDPQWVEALKSRMEGIEHAREEE